MRKKYLLLAASSMLLSAPAIAGDAVLFGPPQPWIVPVAASNSATATGTDNAVTVLLDNQQGFLEKGRRQFFFQSVYRIDSPQGLDDGNVRLTWDPATEAITVHQLLIRRGNQVIDVLKAGQKFTILRRETNLEAGMFDGRLTATLLPEGLQVGDIIDVSATYDHIDPVTKNETEVEIATFNDNPIGRGYARLSWPASLPVSFHVNGDLRTPKVTRSGATSVIELDLRDIEPMIPPRGAPGRFRVARGIDASTFANWAAVGELMKPYFDTAAIIPSAGPLRDAVEKIKGVPGDDKARATAALKLVQDDVRYVALNMGAGGYIPASAETTWSRRFGDCKAKTALLLGILRELKINSEPVLVNTNGADGLDRMQPELAWFNHVLVRATLGGRSYWLDGTRSGDIDLNRIQTPAFDWGLPLAQKASLVRMVPEPLTKPAYDIALDIDAREGIILPAPVNITYVLRGDAGQNANIKYQSTAPSQRDRFLRDFFKSVTDDWASSLSSVQPDQVSARFDPQAGEFVMAMTGKAKLDWSNDSFYLAFSSIADRPSFERTEGVNRDAPIAIDYPSYVHLAQSIRLPQVFLRPDMKAPDVNETIAGQEYRRTARLVGDKFIVDGSVRAITPEVPYAQAVASASRLRELAANTLSINIPSNYRSSDAELKARMASKLTTASEYLDRGNSLLNAGKYVDAISDFTAALAVEPKNVIALGDRALAYTYTGKDLLAEADIKSAMAIDPKVAVVHRARGLLAEQREHWAEAVQAFDASLAIEQNGFAMGHRGIALAAMNRDDEALTQLQAAIDRQPSWYGLRGVRARIFLKRHQCEPVLKDAATISEKGDGEDDALLLAAQLYVACQHRQEAVALLSNSLARKQTASAYAARAAFRPLDDRAARMADIDSALKLEPKKANWIYLKGDELDRTGDGKAALAYYTEALKTLPDDFGIATRRAALMYRLGQVADASRLFGALRARAKDATKLNMLCWEKATSGILLESALDDCNAALKMSPDAPAYLDSLGMTFLRLGRYQEAIKAYDVAIAKGTGAISLMGRSIAYAELGEQTKAAADRKAALADDPDVSDRARRFGLKF